MKRRGVSTNAPRRAREIVQKTLAQAQRNDGKPTVWVRTTFKAPAKTLEELKVHALRLGVDMNDLLLLGANIVLRQAGLPSHLAETDLRAAGPKNRD